MSVARTGTAEQPSVDLTVVIVSYNVRYFLEQCLYSVRRAAQALDTEIIVVDNASADDSAAYLQSQQDLRVILNEVNVGFAKANNQAIRIARGRYVLLLNPDTLVEANTFRTCLERADADPSIGALGARMLDGTGQYLPESKRGLPTPWVSFTKMSGLSRFAPNSARFNGYYLGHLPADVTADVDVLPGAFMWLRREALEAVGGGLDEDYFMYGEDIDLSFLIQRAGFRVVYDPAVQIIHYKGESTQKRSWHYVKAFYRAMAIFSRKHLRTGAEAQQPLLEAAIYGRAAVAVVANAFAKTLPVILDAVLLLSGLLLAKRLWASYYFGNADYYAQTVFNSVNAPLYVSLWIVGLMLSGAYDKPLRLWSMVKGIGIGCLLILLVYALLPAAYHTSRAIVLLASSMSIVSLGVLRLVWSLVRPSDVLISRMHVGVDRRLAIVGDKVETDRALALLARVGVARDYLGRVSPKLGPADPDALGSTKELAMLVETLSVDEVIFCLADTRVEEVTRWMQIIGPQVAYRTLAPGAEAIVGSPFRDAPGELYAIRRQYQLANASARRRKRILDVAFAAGLLLAFPLVWIFHKGGGRVLHNALRVLVGLATWVGYARTASSTTRLPQLRPCVLPHHLLRR